MRVVQGSGLHSVTAQRPSDRKEARLLMGGGPCLMRVLVG